VQHQQQPIILSISSFDPTGSAGLQADIETAASLGVHATNVVSSVIIRDTQTVKDIHSLPVLTVIEQCRALLEDCQVKVIKIGFLGSIEHIQAIHSLLVDYQDIPIVLDPVVFLCTDGHVDEAAYSHALQALLIPYSTVVTPCTREAFLFTGEQNQAIAAELLLEKGCGSVLITDSHSRNDLVVCGFYQAHRQPRFYHAKRVPASLHGLGSTLATAIACGIAHGVDIPNAIKQAHQFAACAAANAFRIGMGRAIPGRFHWCKAKQNTDSMVN